MTTAKHDFQQSFSQTIKQTDALLQSEEILQLPLPELKESLNSANSAGDNLKSLQGNQKNLNDLQSSLDKLIGVITENQSFLSKMAEFWGELPLWIKIGTGFALIVPTLAIGIAFNIWFLVAVSAFTLITYTLVSLLLDNHHNNSVSTLEGLREGIASLGNALITVINSLEIIRQNFTQALDAMAHENERLSGNVNTLTQQVKTFTHTIENLQTTERDLRDVNSELATTSTKLTQALNEQTQLAQISQSELNQATFDFKNTQILLTEKMTELEQVKQEMTAKAKQYQGLCTILQESVHTLSGTVINDKDSRGIFLQKLNDFIANKETTFDRIAERICDAEHQLAIVTAELDLSNKRYHTLLQRHETQISRLEQIVDKREIQNTVTSHALSSLGFYATKQNPIGYEYISHQEGLSVC